MQVSIDNDELEKKVAIALKGINGRSLAQAILKCIIIKAKEDEILLEATNLEIGLRVKVDGTVEEEGCCAIDGKSLADISRKMPDGDVVIQSDEKTAVISGKKVKIKLPVSDVESFPGLPDLTEMEVSCSVLQGALKDALNGVLFSIAVTEVNQMLSVVHVKCEEGQMRLTGLDGHRIAIRALEVQTEEMELNLPGIPLKEIAKLLNSEEQKVDLCVTEHLACFLMPDVWASMRLVEGKYFDLSAFLQDKTNRNIRIDKTQLKDSVSRALLLLADKVQKPLVVQVAENKVTLEAATSFCAPPTVYRYLVRKGIPDMPTLRHATTAGEMSEAINVVTEGESGPLRIGYNPRYLMEILQAIEDETIDLSLGGVKDPCLIKGMDYLYVLLPVSLGKTEAAL